MLRILQIMDNIGIDRGVAAVVLNLYRKIDRDMVQFDFLVCTRLDNSFENEILEMGGNITYVGNPLSLSENTSSRKNISLFFKRHIKEYNIVHLHSPTIALFTLSVAKKYGIEHRIVHSHSSMTSTNKLKAIINVGLMSAARKYANHYWACSSEAANFLFGKHFCKKNKIELIKNAIDANTFYYNQSKRHIMRQELGVENKKLIIHISNFTKVKNVLFLVPVIKDILNTHSEYQFIFIGNGNELKKVRCKLESEVQTGNVIFTGRISNVFDYLQAADLLLLPSLKEGLPVSVIEAQACGVKCLVSDTITREANIGGVSYLPLKKRAWVTEIIQISTINNEERAKLSLKYKQSNFNIETQVHRLQELYMTMLEESR